MIEYQEPHSNKRVIIKIIAWVVIFIFTWNQIAYSGDLFSFRPSYARTEPVTAAGGSLGTEELDTESLEKELQTEDSEKIRLTYYDQFYYKDNDSPIRKLLPSSKDQEQSSDFSPNYLKRQQNKHEDVIRQKEGMESLIEDLFNRRNEREEAELPLKKKK